MGSLEELFVRHEVTFSTLRDEDSIADWLSNSGKHAPKSSFKGVSEKISEPFKIEDKAEEEVNRVTERSSTKRFQEVERELGKLRTQATKIDLNRQETIRDIDERISTVRIQRLQKSGRTTTIFTERLKRADTEQQIDIIIQEAEDQLEGKNLETIKEQGEFRRNRLLQ